MCFFGLIVCVTLWSDEIVSVDNEGKEETEFIVSFVVFSSFYPISMFRTEII